MHRDLSLRNIMVSYASEVKIIDFGIARGDIGRYKTAPGKNPPPPPPEPHPDIRADDFSRVSESGARINKPGKTAEPALKSLQRFRTRWRKLQIDTGTRIPDLTRYKDRVCLGNITNSSRHLHRRTKKIIAFLDGFTGMYADPYMDRALMFLL